MSEPPHVVVTLDAIYETVQSIDKKVDPLPAQVADHETRLRAVETTVAIGPPRTPWYLWMAPLVSLVALAVALIPKLAGG